MYTLYNIILNLAFVICFPYLLLRAALGKHGVMERMGRLPEEKTENLAGKRVIWFHAASVGEVKALSTVIPQVRSGHPEYALVVSTITKTGRKEAERILNGVELFLFLPVDLGRFVRRTFKRVKPVALILVETELWPNLIREAKKRGSLVALINGRISNRSFRRYLLVKGLFQQTLSHVDILCMQSEEHKRRMILLGAESNRMRITGNMKFDRLLLISEKDGPAGLRKTMSIPDDSRVLVGGSIREGEEQILIAVLKRLRQKHKNLISILAPRHLDRLKHVERVLSDSGISYIRKTHLVEAVARTNPAAGIFSVSQGVILLDTMGELSRIYSLADVAFVGGSLVPVGGHNVLEPAIYGVPVLFGPYVDHFKEEVKILIESGGGIQVKDEEQLYLTLSDLLADDDKRKACGESAKEAIRKRTGVAKRTTDLIFSLFEK
jgi:3-deoxy-D-manno-octulosonic-acid transferase